jgi:serine/threonine protein kinase
MAELTGQRLGQYEIGARIGRGGMASVYRARQLSMDRDVAIKVISTTLSDSPEFVARFEREARVIAHLQHPHILPVIDFGRSGEFVYLVMRLVEGGALSRQIEQPNLTLRRCARFIEQIGSALEYAHNLGIVHRDLKSNNVLLDEFDNCYLTDFGIAKLMAGTTSGKLTSTGAVMGTPAYMAPEQWRSEPIDARTDLYALGVILYELLLGAQPFDADTPFGMMFKHIGEAPPAPCRVNPNLPASVEQVVMCALAKNPAERYPSAGAFVSALRSALNPLPAAILDAPLPRATPEQIAEAAVPPPPPPALAPVQEMNVRPPVAISPPPVYRAPVSTPASVPPVAAPRPAPRRRSGVLRWAALLASALVIGSLVLAAIYLLGGNEPDPLPPAIAENDPTSTPRAPTHTALPSSPTADDQPAAIIASPTVALYPTPTREVLACGDLDSRMHTNQAGRTTLVPALNTTVRAAPGVSSAEVRRIPPGQTFQVVDGPACADAIAWWRIEGVDRNGSWNGWIGEGRDGTYWIEPLDTGSGLCPGAPSPRLAPGEQARVTLDPPLPSRVRAGPSTGSAYLTSIQPGRIFSVLSGPLCDFEGRWWWQIRFGDVEGWMAEGAGEEYYLEPVQE